ncbi:hypothetical protein BP6252_11172 [Coleophoma cylindrospora]|uniref:S-adenosyl-L-methionine-dependent methyltransferase n=1 Tax=Coleophoma cylindrospora TaxID=1849047 RepID=A0A3D8QPB2_9HELO|nr:hypothetical protein BP6252_11172 [Coleophoma cylindrospora]
MAPQNLTQSPQATTTDEQISTPIDTSSTSIANLEADSDDSNDDTDSAIGRSLLSPTASVQENIYNFLEENGRSYHRYKEGRQVEKDRLDLQHHLCGLTFEGLHLAPLKTVDGGLHNVLDIGTGTGIWAIDFATQYPSAIVLGTDLSPIQPTYVPPNCYFEIDDAEDPWVYTRKFEYIHGRLLASCFESHLNVFKSAFSFLTPGGFIELQDAAFPNRCDDGSWNGSSFEKWMGLVMKGAKIFGKDWSSVSKYTQYLEEAGFVDIVEHKFYWPIGTWAKGAKNKKLGLWCKENFFSGLQGFSMAVMTKALGMSAADVDMLLAEVRAEVESKKVHVYVPM